MEYLPKTWRLVGAATLVGALSFLPPTACAQAHFYQGKTITLVQSSDPAPGEVT